MPVFWEKPRGEKGIYGENRSSTLCPCIDILILRLFLGDFRMVKRVLGIVAHFSLLSAKFKGF